MKNLKLVLLSVLFIACCVTSCTNNEPLIEEQNIEESESIITSLAQLRTQFNSQGNVIPTENPTGNIVFDFCFDFVYPLNLSYNNGTTVTVNNLGNLVEVMISSTNDLFIDGIEFPFNVEVYSDTQDAIVVTTIHNEEEFMSLIESCDFDTINSCECTEEYNPVCVDITAPNGVTFLVTYPNACYAECDGFTQEDFVDDCEGNYNWSGENECFTFNFPIDIITDTDETFTINSQEELYNVLYITYYFDFVYSFDVTLDDGTVLSIGNEEAFIALLEYCFDDDDDDDTCMLTNDSLEERLMSCDVYELEIYNQNEEVVDVNQVTFSENGELIVNGEITVTDLGSWSITNSNDELTLTIGGLQNFTLLNGNWDLTECSSDDLEFSNGDYTISLECEDCICTTEVNPVCVEVETGSGTEIITFLNACEAACDGFTANDFVECDNNPSNCSEEDLTAYLQECVWYFNTSLYQNVAPEYFIFNADGSLTVVNTVTNVAVAIGTWSTSQNPTTNQIFLNFITNDVEPYTLIGTLDWTVVVCSEASISLGSGNEFLNLERDCN